MTISQRIFMLLKQKGKKQKELAEYTGISTSAISAWNKNNTNPTAESLSMIADFLEVSLDYLLTGKEKTIENTEDIKRLLNNYSIVDDISKQLIQERAEALAELAAERAAKERAAEQPQKAIQIAAPVADELPPEPTAHSIAYYDYPASAGTGLFLDETTAEKITVVQTPESLRADFAIPIKGDSMEPNFSSGDIVLVESCPCVSRGEVGIFVLDGEAFIKEFGGDRLISHNEKYDPLMLKEYESAVCMGRVLGKAEIIK